MAMIEHIVKTPHGTSRGLLTESRYMLARLYIFILPGFWQEKRLGKKSENVGSYADYRSKERKHHTLKLLRVIMA
jgi:hypothetical protein